MRKNIYYKLISAFIILCIFSVGLVGCKSKESFDYDYDYDYDYDASLSESEAISRAKNSNEVQNKIADYYDLKFYYKPDWGSSKAVRMNSGWEVTLKGNISGYTDDYKTDFDYDNTFRVTVFIYDDGDIGYCYVSVY